MSLTDNDFSVSRQVPSTTTSRVMRMAEPVA